MQIEKNKVVSIDYTLTNQDGTVLDSSEGRQPLPYIQGIGNIIPGLEEALEGKAAGDKLEVSIPPEKGYGQHDESLMQDLPKEQFSEIPNLEPGMQLEARSPEGHVQVIRIAKVEGETVTIDGNHPLAGQTLNFDVKVVEVRDATREELEHGHVHGLGGQQH